MQDRFKQLPNALRERSRRERFAGVPALIAVPEQSEPAPVMVWMHGRTADKELDPGRYMRWIRAGIAAVSLDLPGHGEREGPKLHGAETTPRVLSQMLSEIDAVLDAVRSLPDNLDLDRIGIGGMSAGGMVALRRLCDNHSFVCAAVESTTGWLGELYEPTLSETQSWPAAHSASDIEPIDPKQHLDGFHPIPLLALHSEADQTVPFAGMKAFLDELGLRYERAGSSRELITLKTWPQTGAPYEHAGFGKVAAEAKNIQTEFLVRHLVPE